MYKLLRRKLFSQNFLRNRKLVNQLLGRSSIGNNDLILEIGPGKGIITGQLIQRSKHVLAVEIDGEWYTYLKSRFPDNRKVSFHHKDFLQFRLPALPYKVFANIPFSIEGKIIRKLIDAANPPEDCYLIMMKEVAYRLAAPYKENMFSVLHKPWFEFSIYHHFRRTDFEPVTGVDVVMLRFKKKEYPLIAWSEKKQYKTFIQIGFGHGQPVVNNLQKKYGKVKIIQICRRLGITNDIKPGFIPFALWIRLYNALYRQTQ